MNAYVEKPSNFQYTNIIDNSQQMNYFQDNFDVQNKTIEKEHSLIFIEEQNSLDRYGNQQSIESQGTRASLNRRINFMRYN